MGDEDIYRMIGEWQQMGQITKKQASDHRKMIREVVKKDMKCNGNELIDEIDKKIKEATRFFI